MRQRAANYWRSFSFVGLTFATLLFSASVTPSLLPRNYVFQGLLSGLSIAIGYAVGVLLVLAFEFFEFSQPDARAQRYLKRLTVVVVACVFVAFLWRMTFWQNSIRELMEMPKLESAYPYRTAAIAIAFAALLVALGRSFVKLCQFFTTKLQTFLPRRVAMLVGVVIVAALTLFVTNDVITKRLLYAADSFFLELDELADGDLQQPPLQLYVVGGEPLVRWTTIGRQGKNFLASSPGREEISEFLGREALQPIRVYVGMRSGATPEERADLALAELKRSGGFDRSVLIVATPTGTGWLDPSAVNTVEFMHAGDTAIVSTQYSYLPSWITILVDPRRSIESSHALFDKVYAHWKTLPRDSRPRLYLHGLSLGSLGSESTMDLFSIIEDPIDGAVWSGPPFPSPRWSDFVQNRNPGSRIWLPDFRDGRLLRFTGQQNSLEPGKPWGPMRNVYIQYASDPMVWFSPDLAFSRPSWLGEERGPDVSPHLRWYPVITFLQVAFDLPMATSVPIGFGHNYSPANYIDAWSAVSQPGDWTAEDTQRLKARFAGLVPPKP